jgi:hypothetical protein
LDSNPVIKIIKLKGEAWAYHAACRDLVGKHELKRFFKLKWDNNIKMYLKLM